MGRFPTSGRASALSYRRPRPASYGSSGGRRESPRRRIIVYIATSADGFIARKDGSGGGGFGIKAQNYVFTHRPAPPAKGVTFVDEPVRDFATCLRPRPGKNIWIMGGGGIIGSFLDDSEIDEFIIHVVPTFIGDGLPLIAPRHRNVPLRLESPQAFDGGVVRLHYHVEKGK